MYRDNKHSFAKSPYLTSVLKNLVLKISKKAPTRPMINKIVEIAAETPKLPRLNANS